MARTYREQGEDHLLNAGGPCYQVTMREETAKKPVSFAARGGER